MCVEAECVLDSCHAGFTDCDEDAANGCEAECIEGSACATDCGSTGALDCADACAPSCATPAETCDAVDDDCDGACDEDALPGCRVGVHRAVGNIGHYYTTELAEITRAGMTLEGEDFSRLYATETVGLVPLYRCTKPSGRPAKLVAMVRRAALALVLGLTACEEPATCVEEPGFVCPVAGTGEYAFNRDGLPATQTDLFLPSAARRGPDGRVYVMDFNNQRFRVIDDDGSVQTVMGNGFHAIASTEVGPLDTPLENPIDFRFLSEGRLVFVSYHDPRVLELGADGLLHTIAGAADGILGVTGDEGDGGPALDALFIQLDGIAVAHDDTIYVSDSKANRVRVIRGGMIDTIAGTGEAAYTGDGGPAVDAALFWPTALELDGDGNLYIADARNHVVRRVAVDGTITTIAGIGVAGTTGDGGPATAAQLRQPQGLAIGDDGSIYIGGAYGVRRIDGSGTIDTVAGSDHQGDADGPALDARFAYIARVSLDDDALLVADQSNSRIRRVDLR